jgi:hypothetical protein
MATPIVAHLRYASYVARHKWFVFLAGLKTGAPLWRLIVHDWSKLSPAEWGPYVETFYRPLDPSIGRGQGDAGVQLDKRLKAERKARFDKAWLHHQHRNPHHWQHWLLREDDGPTEALPMPPKLAREMVADWMGAGRAITGKWEVAEWYGANYSKILLAPDTRKFVEELIEVVDPIAA